ncbi:SOS response-associated peptidase [Methylosarcina fibrata]|uniref:SOS response-associated peptidase n=1 Tax=Methylosarcina fibrata TaxID=105972 RepID=UPI00037E5B40|nr:SOS response-associated peptidase [Methylosarcina fibrata]
MCGRFALYSDPYALSHRFSTEAPLDLPPRFNIAPTQSILIIREESNKRQFTLARWGLVPHWAKTIEVGYTSYNARAETVAQKPGYREAFKRRRCLIPADGYYQWQAVAGSKAKQPWFIVLRNQLPMALAGLWEEWRSPAGENLESCVIIVTEANALLRSIYNRMPVVLAPAHWNDWLELRARDTHRLQNLLKPYPSEEMAAWPVSRKVNNPMYDSEKCIETVN